MTIGDLRGAVPGETYHGFAGPRPTSSDGEKRRRTITALGVVLALGLGVGAGMIAKPKLLREQVEMAPVRQTTGPQLAIEVARRPPPAPPPAVKSEKLEVLPVELAQAAPRAPSVQRVEQRVERPAMEDEPPIDCRAPADDHEARICRDIGWGQEIDNRPLEIPPPEEDY